MVAAWVLRSMTSKARPRLAGRVRASPWKRMALRDDEDEVILPTNDWGQIQD